VKILLIGKDNFLNWTNNIKSAFNRIDSIELDTLYTNRLGLFSDIERNIKKVFKSQDRNSVLKNAIENKIESYRPDVIFVISPFFFDKEIFSSFEKFDSIIKLAWVGDQFLPERRSIAKYFNKIYCTDTSFIESANEYLFPEAKYLPLAYDDEVFYDRGLNRENSLLFIGSHTPQRSHLLNKINDNINIPVKLIGQKWKKHISSDFDYSSKNISIKEVANEYNTNSFVLNLNNELNAINGLNMRTFEAIAAGSCLIQDNVKDVVLNFTPDEDIIVYNSIDEIGEIIARVTKDRDLYNKIINNGKKVVQSRHTYKHRAEEILRDLS